MKTIYCNSTVGTFVLASYLHQQRPDHFKFVELTGSRTQLASALIDPDSHVCLSIGSLGDLRLIENIAEQIRSLTGGSALPSGKLIAGGSAFSYFDARQMMAYFEEISHVVIGRGEVALLGILDGKIAPGLIDSSALPQHDPYELSDALPWHRQRPVPIGRHDYVCQWGRCRFCHHSEAANATRSTVEVLAKQIVDYHRRFGSKFFIIYDNHLEPDELDFLLCYLRDRKTRVFLDLFGMRMIPAVLPLEPRLREINMVRSIGWGLELYSQRVLNEYRKGILLLNMAPILQMAQRCGIFSRVYILFGLPGCADEDYEATRKFLSEHAARSGSIGQIMLSWFLLSGGLMESMPGGGSSLRVRDPYCLHDYFGDASEFSGIRTAFHAFDTRDPASGAWLSRDDEFLRHAAPFRELMLHPRVIFDHRSFFLKAETWKQVWGDSLNEWMQARSAPIPRLRGRFLTAPINYPHAQPA